MIARPYTVFDCVDGRKVKEDGIMGDLILHARSLGQTSNVTAITAKHLVRFTIERRADTCLCGKPCPCRPYLVTASPPEMMLASISYATHDSLHDLPRPIEYLDSITFPSEEGNGVVYLVKGLIFFTGEDKDGHYRPVIRMGKSWTLYDGLEVMDVTKESVTEMMRQDMVKGLILIRADQA